MKNRFFIKDWEDMNGSEIAFTRKDYKNNYAYALVINDDKKWFYHLIKPDGTNIFKPVGSADSDYTFSKEESQKIVDDALEEAGWSLLEDKLKILLDK